MHTQLVYKKHSEHQRQYITQICDTKLKNKVHWCIWYLTSPSEPVCFYDSLGSCFFCCDDGGGPESLSGRQLVPVHSLFKGFEWNVVTDPLFVPLKDTRETRRPVILVELTRLCSVFSCCLSPVQIQYMLSSEIHHANPYLLNLSLRSVLWYKTIAILLCFFQKSSLLLTVICDVSILKGFYRQGE